jgi:hypothetical protein
MQQLGLIKDHVRNPPVRDEISGKVGGWPCRMLSKTKLTPELGEPDCNAVGMNGLCCDVCADLSSKELRSELKVDFNAIQQVGNKGESKLTEWIRGNTRPWMKIYCSESRPRSFLAKIWFHILFPGYNGKRVVELYVKRYMVKANKRS